MIQEQQRQQQQSGYSSGYTNAQQDMPQPRRRDVFLHLGKTFRLIGSLIRDRRIPLWRKLLFIGSIGGLLVILFFPDALNEAFLSVILPVIGTITGVPIDAGFDWVAFALVVVNLLKFFPASLVAEHYDAVFKNAQQVR